MRTRELMFQIHLWIGLILCVPLVLQGLTGSILVFEDDLRDMAGPKPAMLAVGEQKPLTQIVAAAAAKAPEGTQLTMLRFDEGKPVTVMFGKPRPPERKGDKKAAEKKPEGEKREGMKQEGAKDGKAKPKGRPPMQTMTVDPVSLEVTTAPAGGGVLGFIAQWHTSLLLREYGGRTIVGWFGVAMLYLGVSGLVLWWPAQCRWKAAFVVKKGATGLRLHRDLHGVIGIWMYLVFITSSFTGVYLAFPDIVGGMIRGVTPARDIRTEMNEAIVTPVEGVKQATLDEAAAAVLAAVPQASIGSIRMPGAPDAPIRFLLRIDGAEEGAPLANALYDPWQKQVMAVYDPRAYNGGETAIAWQHSLHVGHGLGMVWTILTFIMGFAPLAFAITGVSMWLIKRRAKEEANGEVGIVQPSENKA